jgi:tetratricopeptide (TPR) repeat protein
MTNQDVLAEKTRGTVRTEGVPAKNPASPPREDYRFSAAAPAEKIPLWLIVVLSAAIGSFIAWQFADDWNKQWYRFLSIKRSKDRDPAGAIKALQALMDLPPDKKGGYDSTKDPTLLGEMAEHYLTLDPKKAEEYARKAQANRANVPTDDQDAAPPPTDFSTQIGRTLYLQGNLTGAEEMFLAGLKTDKLDPMANFHMGEIEYKRGNYLKAGDYFKVVARNPAFENIVKKYYAEIEQKLFAGLDKE